MGKTFLTEKSRGGSSCLPGLHQRCRLFSICPEWITGGFGSAISQEIGFFSSSFIQFPSLHIVLSFGKEICKKSEPIIEIGSGALSKNILKSGCYRLNSSLGEGTLQTDGFYKGQEIRFLSGQMFLIQSKTLSGFFLFQLV